MKLAEFAKQKGCAICTLTPATLKEIDDGAASGISLAAVRNWLAAEHGIEISRNVVANHFTNLKLHQERRNAKAK